LVRGAHQVGEPVVFGDALGGGSWDAPWQMKLLKGPVADWWRSGIDQMIKNRHKQLY
jgi:hypothetical protein